MAGETSENLAEGPSWNRPGDGEKIRGERHDSRPGEFGFERNDSGKESGKGAFETFVKVGMRSWRARQGNLPGMKRWAIWRRSLAIRL